MITVYYCYDTLNEDGKYYDEIKVPKSFDVRYPMTKKAIPTELKTPKFDWRSATWIEMEYEHLKQENEQLKQELEEKKDLLK